MDTFMKVMDFICDNTLVIQWVILMIAIGLAVSVATDIEEGGEDDE